MGSTYFNRKYGGVGHVWQGRYKSSLIDKENYFIWCGLYVELNPVRARLVVGPEDWQWSSYNFYAFGKTNPATEGLIDVDPYYIRIGKKLSRMAGEIPKAGEGSKGGEKE